MIPDNLKPFLNKVIIEFNLNSKLRLAHFLAQVDHESGGFKFLQENLNYSANGLLTVFKKYFDADSANEYAHKPQMIASRVYANRMGNGDELSQEGWKYHGRGYIQLTGKDNYQKFSTYCNVDFITNPDLLATLEYGMKSAGWFWMVNNLNPIADMGTDDSIVKNITRKINGGLNGIEDRLNKFAEYYQMAPN